jgi:hypothetical protein
MVGDRRESKRVGVLAEDQSDCDALAVIIRRLRSDNLGVNSFGAKGAARLMRKALPRINQWLEKGCVAFIVVHDLDRDKATGALRDQAALIRELEAIEYPRGAERRLICVPVEELEAWFWSDQNVLDKVARGNPVKASHQPHKINDPKGELTRLSRRNGKSQYSTNDNEDLARLLDLKLCVERCPEFAELCHFVEAL